MEKKELRKALKAQRNALSTEEVARSSTFVCQHILANAAYQEAEHILGYLAFGKELSLDAVLEQALAEGKKVYVPHIISATEFVAVQLSSLQDLALDRYGIRCVKEPVKVLEPSKLDLVLVPAVAFARDGNRLGMGAGYYDRFLLKCLQAVQIGVAYAALLQDEVPTDAYDVPVPYLATESGIVQTI